MIAKVGWRVPEQGKCILFVKDGIDGTLGIDYSFHENSQKIALPLP